MINKAVQQRGLTTGQDKCKRVVLNKHNDKNNNKSPQPATSMVLFINRWV